MIHVRRPAADVETFFLKKPKEKTAVHIAWATPANDIMKVNVDGSFMPDGKFYHQR